MFDAKRSFVAIVLLGFAVVACEIKFDGFIPASSPQISCSQDFDAGEPDADASTADASVHRDAGARDSDVVLDPPPTDPFVAILPVSSCNGRRLGATNAFTEYARLGFESWHLCYETPAVADGSVDTLRPSRVTLFHFDPSSLSLIEDATLIAPRDGDPWTGNAMIAGSVLFMPYFGLSLLREDGTVSWTVTLDDRGHFVLAGHLRLWRIGPDGTQESVRVHYLCRPPDSPSPSTIGFIVPESACPSDQPASACGLSQFVCQSL